jgi:hypothetical protein
MQTKKVTVASKLTMPSGKVGVAGQTYIAKMLYFCNSQPQKFGWILHEIRRTLKDYNKRKGTYYSAMSENEVDEKLRPRFKICNDALYREFEVHTPRADFQAAHRPYSYGTNGGSSSDQWACSEGNGLRILHFFVTRLIKVDCEHVEGIEADLMDCPSLFGTGNPSDAVDKVNVILDEAERVDAQVGYRVVLRICDVLSKRHPLFSNLHTEKLKPSAVTERRNARPELFRLMTEVATILINIGDNEQHWKVNQVKVEIGIKTYAANVIMVNAVNEPVRNEGRGIAKISQVDQQRLPEKRKADPQSAGGKELCRHENCQRPAFCHKKERGGQVHGSKMCFDHFLLGVEDSKLSKPVGIPIKGGKTMIAKRGADKSWEDKIFNFRLKEHDGVEKVRQNTFLKRIGNEDAEELLRALHNEFDNNSGELKVYQTSVDENGTNWENFASESGGTFDLPDVDGLIDDEEILIYDVNKRQRLGQDSPQQSLYLDERATDRMN